MNRHVVICGFGHIGYRTFQLLRRLNVTVSVICDKNIRDWPEQVIASGGQFIQGDAQLESTLIRAGVQSADSVLALTDNDLTNLNIALTVAGLNSKAKLICRFFDVELGAELAKTFPIQYFFSTSEIAAPFFSSAAEVPGPEPLLHFEVRGTRITGFAEERGVCFQAETNSERKKEFILSRMISYLLAPGTMKFRRLFTLFSAIFAVGTLVISFGMNLSLIDAAYFVATTVTTVGYGDFNFLNAGPLMKVFGIGLMFAGAAALATIFSLFSDFLLTEKFGFLLGGKQIPKRNHRVLAGGNRTGHRVAEEFLSAGDVVLIEGSEFGGFSPMTRAKSAVISVDSDLDGALEKARIRYASELVVVGENDISNLSLILRARRINDRIKIRARLFDADLSHKMQNTVPRCRFYSVSTLAAPYFAAAVLTDEFVSAGVVGEQLIVVRRHRAAQSNEVKIEGMSETLFVDNYDLR